MEIPKKIQKEIKQWAKETGQSVKDIVKDLEKETKEAYLKSLKGEKQITQAWRGVRARLAKVMKVPTRAFLIQVVDKTDSRVIKTKAGEDMAIANAWGIIQAVDDKELGSNVYFMRAVGMREAASIIDTLEAGNGYECHLALDHQSETILNVSFVDKKSIPKTAESMKDKKVRKIIMEMFERVDIADAAFKVSEDTDDLKAVEGSVVSARTPTSKKGNVYGRYTLIDDSMDMKAIKESGGLRVMCDPSQVTVADGSDIVVIGTIDSNDRGVSMRAECIIPTYPIPRVVKSIEDDDETPDIDDSLVDSSMNFDEDDIKDGGESKDEDESEDEDEEDEDESEDEDEEDEDESEDEDEEDEDESEDEDEEDEDESEDEDEEDEPPKKANKSKGKEKSKPKSKSKDKKKKTKIPEDDDDEE